MIQKHPYSCIKSKVQDQEHTIVCKFGQTFLGRSGLNSEPFVHIIIHLVDKMSYITFTVKLHWEKMENTNVGTAKQKEPLVQDQMRSVLLDMSCKQLLYRGHSCCRQENMRMTPKLIKCQNQYCWHLTTEGVFLLQINKLYLFFCLK